MKSSVFALGLVALAVSFAQPASAGITVYTDRASFEAALQPDYYLESKMFTTFPDYGGNGYSYSASIPSGSAYGLGGDLTYLASPGQIVFNFTSPLKAFGGYFYTVDLSDQFTQDPFTVALNNGSSLYSYTSPTNQTFYGFISDADLVNATIGSGAFAVAGSVIVGTPPLPPAPAPLPLLGAAAAFGYSRRLRQRLAAGRQDG